MLWLDCPRCGRRPLDEFTFGGERRTVPASIEGATPLMPLPPPEPPPVEPPLAERTVPPPSFPAPVADERVVFLIWLAVFVLVGAQMSWVLRPFIGSPGSEFTWFRPRESSFFEAVMTSIWGLLGGR